MYGLSRELSVAPELQRLSRRPESISQLVYDAIRDGIVDKTLPPGSSVSEAGLARSLDVSKTPVREALLRLRECDLVEADGNRGLRVVLPSRERITHAYETRRALEPEASALAAERATNAQRAQLRDTAERSVESAEAGSPQDFSRLDREFHHAIAEAAASPRLERLAKDALLLTRVLRARDVPISGDSVKCAQEHVSIADAIAQGDGALADELATGHVRHVLSNVLAAFAVTEAGQGDVGA